MFGGGRGKQSVSEKKEVNFEEDKRFRLVTVIPTCENSFNDWWPIGSAGGAESQT